MRTGHLWAAAALAAGLHTAQAGDFSFTGNLDGADDQARFVFGVDANSTVVIRTLSYAGGVNAVGDTIPAGGFDPVLSVFNSGGLLLFVDDDGRGVIDPVTGLAYDSEIMALLDPGDYTTVLTQFANFPAGSTLAEGFTGSGFSEDGRTSFYAVDFLSVSRVRSENTGRTAPSNVTSSALITQTATIQPSIVGRRVVNRVLQGQLRDRQTNSAQALGAQGMSAGDDGASAAPSGWWGSMLKSSIENNFEPTEFDSDVITMMAGVDGQYNNLLVGVAFSYEGVNTDTDFVQGKQDTDTLGLIPYAGYLINDWLSADLSFGYSHGSIDQSRRLAFLNFESSPDAKRWFVATNLNAVYNNGPWLLSGGIGWLYAKERINSFTERAAGLPQLQVFNESSRAHLSQGRIGVGASYFHKGWEPFVTMDYAYDFSRSGVSVGSNQNTPLDDDDEVRFGAGVRYFNERHGVTSALEVMNVVGRNDIENRSVNLTIRIDL